MDNVINFNMLIDHLRLVHPTLQIQRLEDHDCYGVVKNHDTFMFITRKDMLTADIWMVAGMIEVFCQKDEKSAKFWLKQQKCKKKGLWKAINETSN